MNGICNMAHITASNVSALSRPGRGPIIHNGGSQPGNWRMLKCKDITEQSDGYLAGDLGFYRTLQVRIHLLMCRFCRRYVRQSSLLIMVMRQLYSSPSSGEVPRLMQAIRTEKKDHGNG